MKKKLSLCLVLILTLATVFGVTASAYTSYETYTYSIDGDPLLSPTAYETAINVTSEDMGLIQDKFGKLGLSPRVADIVVDKELKPADYKEGDPLDSNVYIVDTGYNRIVILNKYYDAIATIDEYVDEYGQVQKFSEPEGIFVTDPNIDSNHESFIYVCDTGNARIVVFDRQYNYVRTIEKPESQLLKEGAFKPTAIAVDLYGRIFVVSPSCTDGVIVMSSEGDFTGFIGAQKVTYSVIEMIWREFQTAEQRKNAVKNVSVAYNNITVDDEGFVYVTSNKVNESKQLQALQSKAADYSPIKKLNSAGKEIMKRNGFFDPGGEVMVSQRSNAKYGVSKIIDVAIGSEKSWTILDNDSASAEGRLRFFTYDQDGNLLFAFGQRGDQMGNGENVVGITYHNVDGINYLVALDRAAGGSRLTVYAPTPYCETIMSALRNQNEHNYSRSIDFWQDVLTLNNNFDMAYIGIGKALMSQGKYAEAQEMLSKAYETDTWSKAFNEIRKDVIGNYLLPIVIGVIVVLVAFLKFLGWAKKKNKATSLKVGRKTYVEELLFVFHLWFHPFDGFWDLKHEQRGSVRAGTTILGITIAAFFYQSIGQGYTFNPRENYSTIFVQILALGVPVLLWCVANWCLTTLFDGEGGFKDIYISTTYSLSPLPLLVILSTILTNVFTVSEGQMITLLVTIGWVWAAILLFFGTLVTHDYTINKNILTVLGTIVAMGVIMFVAILFSSLLIKMITFVVAIITEIANRAS